MLCVVFNGVCCCIVGGDLMKCVSYNSLFGSNGFYNKRLEKNTIYVGKARYLPLSIVKNFKLHYLHEEVKEIKIVEG